MWGKVRRGGGWGMGYMEQGWRSSEVDRELIWLSATGSPTTAPSMEPLVRPTSVSSMNPAQAHSIVPTGVHSIHPSQAHLTNPSKAYSIIPTEVHSTSPSQAHTTSPSQAGWCEGPRAVPDGRLLVADPPGGITGAGGVGAFCFLSRSPRENLVVDVGEADSAAGSLGGAIILVVPGREGEWGYQFDLSVGDYQRNDVVGGWSGPNKSEVRGRDLRALSGGACDNPRAGRVSQSAGGGLRLKQAVGVLQSGGEV